MSTIVLYKDRLNGINTYINDVTNSCDSLSTQLNSLKKRIILVTTRIMLISLFRKWHRQHPLKERFT